MIKLQSAIVYYGILLVMVCLGKKAAFTDKWKYCVWAMVVYSVIMGLRFGVGIDFFTYKDVYEIYRTYGFDTFELYGQFEIGFSVLMAVMGELNFPSPLFFGIIAFFQIFFLALIFKEEKRLLPWLFFAFITAGLFLEYANIIRSALAISIGLYSFKYIVQKKPLIHYSLLLLASTMHMSIVVLVVFYPIFSRKQEWLSNRFIQIVLLIVAFIIMQVNIIQDFLTWIDTMATFLGYGGYLTDNRMDQKISLGIGFMIQLMISIIIMWYSKDAKKFYDSKYFNLVYSVFVIGLFFHYCFINSMLLSRVVDIIYYSYVVVYAYMLYYLKSRKKMMFYIVCGCLLLLLMSPVISDVKSADSYVFIWQDEWCRIKDNYLNPMKVYMP